METIFDRLVNKISEELVHKNELMSKHTSFKIGGPADILITPASVEDIKNSICICHENNIDYTIIGNGSNLLVSDKGIRGVVIKISDKFNQISINENEIKAQAGVLLSVLANKAMEMSLGGFEFASGIPGTLGGAVTMNAGAYGGEMKDVVTEVTAIDKSGNIIKLNNEEANFGYRTSKIQENDYIVLETIIKLKNFDKKIIKEKTAELTQKRTSKQPLHLPSAGSTFKRPTGYFAGKLIQDSGLKGTRIGDAQVSEKHSGFIVNVGKASFEDVYNLIKLVQKVVRDKYDVELQTEVKILGEL